MIGRVVGRRQRNRFSRLGVMVRPVLFGLDQHRFLSWPDGTVIRHFRHSLPIGSLSGSMFSGATTRALVVPVGPTARFSASSTGAIPFAVLISPITASADQCQPPASSALKLPWIVLSVFADGVPGTAASNLTPIPVHATTTSQLHYDGSSVVGVRESPGIFAGKLRGPRPC